MSIIVAIGATTTVTVNSNGDIVSPSNIKISSSTLTGTVPDARLGTNFLRWNGSASGLTNYLGVNNVQWYGAKGDGTNDDTSAIQTAINSVTNFSKSLYFPAGIYMISAPLIVSKPGRGMRIYGDNRINTIIKVINNANIPAINISGVSDWSVENLAFRSYGGSGIRVTNSSSGTISDCLFQYAPVAINISDSYSIVVLHNILEACDIGICNTNGLFCNELNILYNSFNGEGHEIGIIARGVGLNIQGNTMENEKIAINMVGQGANEPQTSYNSLIENNYFEGVTNPIVLATIGNVIQVTIRNNYMRIAGMGPFVTSGTNSIYGLILTENITSPDGGMLCNLTNSIRINKARIQYASGIDTNHILLPTYFYGMVEGPVATNLPQVTIYGNASITNGNLDVSGSSTIGGTVTASNFVGQVRTASFTDFVNFGTNIVISPTNGNAQSWTLTNASWATMDASATNLTDTISLNIYGSNTLTWTTTTISNATVLGPSNAISSLLFWKVRGTNLWYGYRLR